MTEMTGHDAETGGHVGPKYANGKLEIEDDREVVRTGKEAVRDLVDQWRYGGSLIPEEGHRRAAFNSMLSMPACPSTC